MNDSILRAVTTPAPRRSVWVLFLLILLFPAGAAAQSSRLTITSTNAGDGVLKISGTNFGTYTPSVVLAGTSLKVVSFSASRISTALPDSRALAPGMYLLTVAQTRKNGAEEDGENGRNLFVVSIGSCSPGGGSAWRYVDNADGTVTDCTTGLMWEKKVAGRSTAWDSQGLGNCVHCVDDAYSSTAAMFRWVWRLNSDMTSDPSKVGFAGRLDWRLPTVVELQTILAAPFPCSNAQSALACIDPVFGPTYPGLYQSTSMFNYSGSDNWMVGFANGNALHGDLASPVRVRAVRNAW